jgi:hypothetical protein
VSLLKKSRVNIQKLKKKKKDFNKSKIVQIRKISRLQKEKTY